MLLFTSDLQFLYKSSVFCPQRVFVSKDTIFICQMPIKQALLMHSTLSLMLPVSVFHFTPALAVVGLGSRKSVKYLQQYPFYFPGQPIIQIWQP